MVKYEANLDLKKTPRKQIDTSRKKTTAIILSVFLGFFSWLYTYRLNRKKFWASFIISIAGFFVLYGPIFYSLITSTQVSDISLEVLLWSVFALSNIGVYIWALVDNARRPVSFYMGYPVE